jgi:tetraacyldisaccharide 4'-kinase
MTWRAPEFWMQDCALARALDPLGRLYGAVVAARMRHASPFSAIHPVLCVGNVTLGGSGKTPVVRALVKILNDSGKTPGVLLRGYGGRLGGPVRVYDQSAADVGDEALLHKQDAPTWVSRDRAAGARAMAGLVTHIIMDDGLQNPSLKKDLSFLVVDGETGFGNGRVFPAGPLRETVESALLRVSAVVMLGPDKTGIAARLRFLIPVFHADMVMTDGAAWAGKPVIAFAGIGRPQKFFNALAAHDALVVRQHAFADHQIVTPHLLTAIFAEADKIRAHVVTTRKDWVRLAPEWRARVTAIDAHIQWQDENALRHMLLQKGVL